MSVIKNLKGIITNKCPQCKKGNIFINGSMFPLRSSLRSFDNCPECGNKLKSDTSHAPSLNYAFSVLLYAICFITYALIWGLSYKDNSVIHALIASTVIVIILQPWLIRLSKTTFIYLYRSFH